MYNNYYFVFFLYLNSPRQLQKICLICLSDKEVNKVILCSNNSKEKFSNTLKIWQMNSFKLCVVVLPQVFNASDGHHIKYYRKFVAFPSTLQNQIYSYSSNASKLSSSVHWINTRSNQSPKLIESNTSIVKSCKKIL